MWILGCKDWCFYDGNGLKYIMERCPWVACTYSTQAECSLVEKSFESDGITLPDCTLKSVLPVGRCRKSATKWMIEQSEQPVYGDHLGFESHAKFVRR